VPSLGRGDLLFGGAQDFPGKLHSTTEQIIILKMPSQINYLILCTVLETKPLQL
jgi:hypothetical protein